MVSRILETTTTCCFFFCFVWEYLELRVICNADWLYFRFRKVRPSVGSCKMALPGNRRARLRNPFHKLIQVNPGAVTHSPGQVDTLDQKSERTANSQIHSADDILAPWACVALDSLLARHDLALLATARRLAPSPMQSF